MLAQPTLHSTVPGHSAVYPDQEHPEPSAPPEVPHYGAVDEPQPGCSTPVTGQPGTGQYVRGQPKVGPLGTGQSVMGQSITGQPLIGQPAISQPGLAQSGMAQPGMNQPVAGQPLMRQLGYPPPQRQHPASASQLPASHTQPVPVGYSHNTM